MNKMTLQTTEHNELINRAIFCVNQVNSALDIQTMLNLITTIESLGNSYTFRAMEIKVREQIHTRSEGEIIRVDARQTGHWRNQSLQQEFHPIHHANRILHRFRRITQ